MDEIKKLKRKKVEKSTRDNLSIIPLFSINLDMGPDGGGTMIDVLCVALSLAVEKEITKPARKGMVSQCHQ